MNVAIIGAGVAGLSCAHELERYGISPVIYERRNFIGEEFPHIGAVLEVAHRPIKDAIKYIKKDFGIDIKPLNTVNSVIHHSPNKTTVIKGNLGYFLERSKGPNDIKVQIRSQLKSTRILFNEYGDYEPLSKLYDYLIIANGHINYTDELGCWRQWANTYVKGAVVYGDFDSTAMTVWINKTYCKNGYAYLSPFDSKRASLNLVVTDISDKEIDEFWEIFLCAEKIQYSIQEEFKINHLSGYVYPHKVGNIFLAGNAGGVLDPFLGFGVMGSITSGVMAVRSIVERKDYEKLLQDIVKQNLRFHEFRKVYNMFNNTGYDFLISSLGLPGLKHIMYYSPLNVVKLGASISKLVPKGK